MAKKLYYPLYWSAEKPVPKDAYTNRYNEVRNGAGTKGAVIGAIGEGVYLVADDVEQDAGWIRIISVKGCDPVPEAWVKRMEEKEVPQVNWEWWIDKTALSYPVDHPGDEVTLMVKGVPGGVWTVKEVLGG